MSGLPAVVWLCRVQTLGFLERNAAEEQRVCNCNLVINDKVLSRESVSRKSQDGRSMQLRNCDTGSANREAGLTKKPVPRATDSEGFDTWVSTRK
jgi:hypothetical protein